MVPIVHFTPILTTGKKIKRKRKEWELDEFQENPPSVRHSRGRKGGSMIWQPGSRVKTFKTGPGGGGGGGETSHEGGAKHEVDGEICPTPCPRRP